MPEKILTYFLIVKDISFNEFIMNKRDHLHTLLQSHQLNFKIHTIWRFQFFFDALKTRIQKKYSPMMKTITDEKPLVYSCSGCSGAAQMANYLALQLDRNGTAEMSCIAGVGGNVKNIVRTALSGRRVIAIDGCPLACSKACLGNHSLKPQYHFELTGFGVKKRAHEDFDKEQADDILKLILQQINRVDKSSYVRNHYEQLN